MNRKNKLILALITLTLTFSSIMMAYAPPTGGLRIDPPLPYMSDTSADFEIWAQSADSYDVQILLVVTQECYDGMPTSNAVVVTDGFSLSFDKSDFDPASSGYVPTSGATNGARYTVASLKDHIDTDGTIYWAMGLLPFNPLTSEHEEITVNLDSSNPRMLVYLMGKSEGAEQLDMRVPPTIPGFVIPEVPLGSVVSLLTMIGSVAVFKLRKK